MKQLELNTIAAEMLSELSGINRASKNTILAYRRDIDDFIRFCFDKNINLLEQVTDRCIRQFVMMLSSEHSEKTTISRKLSSLRKMFDYSIRNQYIEINPIAKIPNPKTTRKLPETFSQDAFKNIYLKIDEVIDKKKLIIGTDTTIKISAENQKIRIKAIFELLYGCALRVSELCSLNICNLDLMNSSLRVIGKGSKTRILPVGIKSAEILERYLLTIDKTDSHLPLFQNVNGRRITRFEVYNLVRKYLGLVSDIHKRSPHILRHSAATHMLDNDADIMAVKEILGHENLSTTQIYTHVSIERLKKTYKKAHPKS